MATETAKAVVSADNCCCGSCSRLLLELAAQNAGVREVIAPEGVQIVARAFARATEVSSDNCCSGALSKRARS